MPDKLTINAMVDMAYSTAKSKGWHDRKDETLTDNHAAAQLATLVPLIKAVAEVAEAIRKPDTHNLLGALETMMRAAEFLYQRTPEIAVLNYLGPLQEYKAPLEGSKTQMQAWLVLMVTELAEAMEAVEKGDKANFAEELADVAIRMGDTVGATNDMPGHFLGPIDAEVEILAKNERNKLRGYRHGGKKA